MGFEAAPGRRETLSGSSPRSRVHSSWSSCSGGSAWSTPGSLSSGELLGVLILGLLLGGGPIAIHAKGAWRERWRTDLRLRVVISLPLIGVIATSLVVSPSVVFLGTAIMAVLFIPVRTYLYLAARAGIDTRSPTV